MILLAQLGSFKTRGSDGGLQFVSGTPLLLMIALVALTTGIIHFLPTLARAVPSSLAAILAVSIVDFGINHSGVSFGAEDRQPVLTVKHMWSPTRRRRR